ncbi:MAG: GNAT family N-acetyltransferase [Chitinophagales bacterium]
MAFLEDNCTFSVLSEDLLSSCNQFDCGHGDLNDFFSNDSHNYNKELLGKTYCFQLNKDPKEIVCAFTISNDSIKTTFLPNSRKKKVNKEIPRVKHNRSYPAVLIGRLGVSEKYHGKGIGRELMDFIKSWFIDSENKTGCRFVVVDSYNETVPISYYSRNGFKFLFSTEEQEKKFMDLPPNYDLKTRLMIFDLIVLSS